MGWQGNPKVMKDKEDEDGEWVCLHPFDHQVGGHTGVLLFDRTTVCKPMVPREYDIYENMSPALRNFVPNLKGWIDVKINKDKEGNTFLRTSKTKEQRNGDVVSCDCQRSLCHSLSASKYSEVEEQAAATIKLSNNGSKSAFSSVPPKLQNGDSNYEVANNLSETEKNPWSLRCWKRQLWIFEKAGVTKNCKYILLENLASKFKHPSILDLKIGTRGYGDDVTEEKRLSHMAKAKLSTTGTIGVRIGGMQVYQVNSDSYHRHTKHYGKQISDYDTLLSTIQEFFHDGNCLRKQVLYLFIQRLKTLIAVIQNEFGSRFFGCSTLILYEGGVNNCSKVDCTHLPSVNISSKVNENDCIHSVPLGNPLKLEAKPIFKRESTGAGVPQKKIRMKTGSSSSSIAEVPLAEGDNLQCCTHLPTSSSSYASSLNKWNLTLKVIDFPHVVYKHKSSATKYEGPDKDFLFGLNNLLQIVEKIFADN